MTTRALVSGFLAAVFAFTPAQMSVAADEFDPVVIDRPTRTTTERPLPADVRNGAMQQRVCVSSSVATRIPPNRADAIAVVSGRATFEPVRPVQYAIDHYRTRRDDAIDDARLDNWAVQGLRAAGYDLAAIYIKDFWWFKPVSLENNLIDLIDPTKSVSERAGAAGRLSWDVASPFVKGGLKYEGTKLLKRQAMDALKAENVVQFKSAVTQLYDSMVFLHRGVQTYGIINSVPKVAAIGTDVHRLYRPATGPALAHVRATRGTEVSTYQRDSAPRIAPYDPLPEDRSTSVRAVLPQTENTTIAPPPRVLFSTKDPVASYTPVRFERPERQGIEKVTILPSVNMTLSVRNPVVSNTLPGLVRIERPEIRNATVAPPPEVLFSIEHPVSAYAPARPGRAELAGGADTALAGPPKAWSSTADVIAVYHPPILESPTLQNVERITVFPRANMTFSMRDLAAPYVSPDTHVMSPTAVPFTYSKYWTPDLYTPSDTVIPSESLRMGSTFVPPAKLFSIPDPVGSYSRPWK